VITSKTPNYALIPGSSNNSSPVQDNMDRYYPTVKEFFSNVELQGSNNQRCKTVLDFIRLSIKGNKDLEKDKDCFACISGSFDSWFFDSSEQRATLKNNYSQICIYKFSRLPVIADFKRQVILAIDSAELRGGTNKQKCDRFREVFPGKVNIIVSKAKVNENLGVYFFYHQNYYHTEDRKHTRYRAWILIQ
jgi:hypothetical protein